MKQMLLMAVLLGGPVPSLAQGSPSPQSQAITPPSSMGRWDEHRKLREKMDRQDETRSAAAQQLVPKQKVINDFAACIWRQAPDKARAALGTAVDTSAERTALRSVAQFGACSHAPYLSGRSGELRGALAENAIHADQGRRARLDALGPVPAVRVPVARGRAFVASFSGCIAAADPAGSLALLGTAVGSPEETVAMRAMATALSGCMPEGAKYSVDVRDVRNHIADALYRMSEVSGA
jgi:threonine dehydrogenase-like Zn-dependent dehydrogenase